MSHFPVDHQLRPVYRLAAAACGGYVLAFGVVGLTRTAGLAAFAQSGLPSVLGLHTNRAFAFSSIVAGAVVLVAAIVGRNIDVRVNIVGGIGFLVVGTAMLAAIPTDANFFGFTLTTCIVSYVLGIVMLSAGMYGKTAGPATPMSATVTPPPAA